MTWVLCARHTHTPLSSSFPKWLTAGVSSEKVNGEQSWHKPCSAADLPAIVSIIIPLDLRMKQSREIIENGTNKNGYFRHHSPIVILDGNPWGLKMMSGTIPDSVKGMFSTGHFWLQDSNTQTVMSLLHMARIAKTRCTCICLSVQLGWQTCLQL